MGVVCFASLKGGVGKTSLAVNVAHALSQRGCRVLLLDIDPSAHAARFFTPHIQPLHPPAELLKLLTCYKEKGVIGDFQSLIDKGVDFLASLQVDARKDLSVVAAEEPLRLLTVLGSKNYKRFFRGLVAELGRAYDYVIIDTPPLFNLILKAALAGSGLVVVPVDSSAMSVRGLEELVERGASIKGPGWAILRTMVSKQASKVRSLAAQRLEQQLPLRTPEAAVDLESHEGFVSFLSETSGAIDAAAGDKQQEPLFLLDSIVYRSELHNKLSFLGRTVFDLRETAHLAEQYAAVAREVEKVLALCEEEGPDEPLPSFLPAMQQWQ